MDGILCSYCTLFLVIMQFGFWLLYEVKKVFDFLN